MTRNALCLGIDRRVLRNSVLVWSSLPTVADCAPQTT